MSSKRPIVAELGRPETPQEQADRKAASSRRYRESKTFTNLVIALAASFGLVLVLVLVVLRPDPPPADPIDVPAVASDVSAMMQMEAIAPAVPETWEANAAELRMGADDVALWYVGYLTPAHGFVSLNQAQDANPTWQSNMLRNARVTGSETIAGIEWQVYDQRDMNDVGNIEFAMTTQVDDQWVVLFGTAGETEFSEFAEAVSAELAS